MKRLMKFFSAALLTSAMACSGGPAGDLGNDPPLSGLDEILEGAPPKSDIARKFDDAKFDGVLPEKFAELAELQSPVKSQGRRGVCSIFSTVALMEHLYIAEGTVTEPDFSEQYLQWSAKFEVGSFPRSSGSNANFNLQAINRFGIPEESAWPYQPNPWGESDDAECDGEDDQPTRCHTNGEPPQEALDAEKFHLPRSEYIHPLDIKAHMFSERTGVVVGLTFFYQSWNHRKSPLPTDSEYWNQGYVTHPNAADSEASLEEDMRAGHSILLIGWDDELEVQKRDGEGNKVFDDDGNPVMEKGFYIFKNSWGTDGFGIDHELGPGYGYISYDYVHQYGRARVAGLPDLGPQPERCDDGRDNDRNGQADCADAACFSEEVCGGGAGEAVFESTESVEIPDNSLVGVSSSIEIADAGQIAALVVDVDISHSFIGDLTVSLVKDGRSILLHDRTGGSQDDLVTSFPVDELDGSELAGTWQLVVTDRAPADVGTVNGWTLRAQLD